MVRVVGTEEPFIGFSSGESMNWFAHTCAFVLVGVAVLLVPLASQSLIARIAAAVVLIAMLRLFFRIPRRGAFASNDALVVRTLWRTRRIAWSDVTGVERIVNGGTGNVVVHTTTGDVLLTSERRDLIQGVAYMRAEIERRQAA